MYKTLKVIGNVSNICIYIILYKEKASVCFLSLVSSNMMNIEFMWKCMTMKIYVCKYIK